MLYVVFSNRLERLAQRVADALAGGIPELADTDPFAPHTIVVPDPAVGRWLSLQLAEFNGIAANLELPLPQRFLGSLVRQAGGELEDESVYTADHLVWPVMEWLQALQADPATPWTEVAEYLAVDRGDATTRATRTYELAVRIAGVLEGYILYRPDWLRSWESGQGTGWQAALWRWLQTRLGSTDPGRRLQRWGGRQVARVTGDGHPPVLVFGVDRLAPLQLAAFQALAQARDVYFFCWNPSRQYWGDVVSEREQVRREGEAGAAYLDVGHPLLAAWGRAGRDFLDDLIEAADVPDEDFHEPSGTTLLHRLQGDLLDLVAPPAPEERIRLSVDASIALHACHGPRREVEVLFDQLLGLLEAHPDLGPSDILVLTPDMPTYAPYIEAVFGAAETTQLPYTLADHAAAQQTPLFQGFLSLLTLDESRYDPNSVLALLELPAVRRRFGLPATERVPLRQWLEATRIHWGQDAADRAAQGLPATAANTWRAGLDRLLLGYAAPAEERDLWAETLPFDAPGGSEAELAGRFTEFVESVFRIHAALAEPRTPQAWCDTLAGLLDHFFAPRGESEEAALQGIHDALRSIRTRAKRVGFQGALSRAVMLARLRTAVAPEAAGAQAFLSGGIAFAGLTPGRALPFPVIALLGMGDGAFPRAETPVDFDGLAQEIRRGDTVRREADRYLALGLLSAARRHLLVTYPGRSARDNTPIPPSVVVSEFLETLDRYYRFAASPEAEPMDAATALITEHPLQPFSPRYFTVDEDPAWFTYAQDLAPVASPADTEPPFITALEPPGPAWQTVELDRLVAFLRHPARFLLESRLGLRLRSADGELPNREPLAPEPAIARALDQQAWTLVADEPPAKVEVERLLQGTGLAPHGAAGERLLERSRANAEALQRRAGEAAHRSRVQTVRLTLDDWVLIGRLSGLSPDGRRVVRPTGPPGPKDCLALWCYHVVLCWLHPPGVEPRSTLIHPEGELVLAPVEAPEALLRELLAIYGTGLTEPSPLLPRSSHAYAHACHRGQSEAEAHKAARQAWVGSASARSWPEGDDAYNALAHRGRDPLASPAFPRVSEAVFGPLFRSLTDAS